METTQEVEKLVSNVLEFETNLHVRRREVMKRELMCLMNTLWMTERTNERIEWIEWVMHVNEWVIACLFGFIAIYLYVYCVMWNLFFFPFTFFFLCAFTSLHAQINEWTNERVEWVDYLYERVGYCLFVWFRCPLSFTSIALCEKWVWMHIKNWEEKLNEKTNSLYDLMEDYEKSLVLT